VIAICAVERARQEPNDKGNRGDSSREGQTVVAIRHPMPYGDLEKQAVQRYATYADLDKNECTIEERRNTNLTSTRAS